MMKFSLIFAGMLATVLFATAGWAQAQDEAGDFGIGGILGDPNGANFRSMFDEDFGFDIGIGFGVIDNDHFIVYGDLLWFFLIDDTDDGTWDFYVGVGPKIGTTFDPGRFLIGGRVPLGIDYVLEDEPIDMFLEFAPGFRLEMDADVEFDFDVVFGVRFWP